MTSTLGRPRSTASRDAILTASLELVAELGYTATTVDRIAARAGTGKQTIYRWWTGKPDVVLDALNETARRDVPVPRTGTLAGDLEEFLTTAFAVGRKPLVAPVLAALMAEAKLDPEFGAVFWEKFQAARLEALTTVLKRHPSDLTVPVSTAVEVVFGIIWYRILVSERRFDRTLVKHMLTLLVRSDTPR